MADIQLRFGKDLLVVGTPIQQQLATIMDAAFQDDLNGEDATSEEGFADIEADDPPFVQATFINTDADTAAEEGFELSLLIEPEIFEEAYRLERASGAQCLVAPTANLTPARLATQRLGHAADDLAREAITVTSALKPEHVFVEVAPCGLPLDASSKASLLENRVQYEQAARLFDRYPFDAFFLNGFARTTDLKCALMGIRKVSDAPIIACVDVDAEGMLAPLSRRPFPSWFKRSESLEQAMTIMAEYGANAGGFCSDASIPAITAFLDRAAGVTTLPKMVQLFVGPHTACSSPDDAFDAALILADAGAQFFQATGKATPPYTGALAAAVVGRSVTADASQGMRTVTAPPSGAPDADRLRQIVNHALGIGEGTDR